MIGERGQVTGDLIVQRSGARAVPIELSGTPRHLRLRVESARRASALSAGGSLVDLGELLARWGVELTVETPRVRLVTLGGVRGPVRVSVLGAAYTLLTTAPWRLPSLVRWLRRTRVDGGPDV